MEKNTVVTIVLGVLLVVALLQFFQITSIADSPTTAVSVETQNTPVKQAPVNEQPAPLPLGVGTTKIGCGV